MVTNSRPSPLQPAARTLRQLCEQIEAEYRAEKTMYDAPLTGLAEELTSRTGEITALLDLVDSLHASVAGMPPGAAASASASARCDTLAFIRMDGAAVDTMALVQVEHPAACEDVIGSLRRAVTEWVRTTETGRRCWRGSSEDLNIGDLANDNAFQDRDLQRFLREQGITAARFLSVGDVGGDTPYDTVLVDRSALEDSRDAA